MSKAIYDKVKAIIDYIIKNDTYDKEYVANEVAEIGVLLQNAPKSEEDEKYLFQAITMMNAYRMALSEMLKKAKEEKEMDEWFKKFDNGEFD